VSRSLPLHRIRAVNTATDSENKIHDDRIAAQYGFRGGLVPGVMVYGYMTVPVINHAPHWIERGAFDVRFVQPIYDNDPVIVRAKANDDQSIRVTAEREDGTVCAIATAGFRSSEPPPLIPEHPLPTDRPVPTRDNLIPGAPLGTVVATLDTLEPHRLLQLSNEILVRNFKLGPWIHARSEITNFSAARVGDVISARARIHDRYDAKGHEFLVADVMLVSNGRLLQTVRHTAIYRIKTRN